MADLKTRSHVYLEIRQFDVNRVQDIRRVKQRSRNQKAQVSGRDGE